MICKLQGYFPHTETERGCQASHTTRKQKQSRYKKSEGRGSHPHDSVWLQAAVLAAAHSFSGRPEGLQLLLASMTHSVLGGRTEEYGKRAELIWEILRLCLLKIIIILLLKAYRKHCYRAFVLELVLLFCMLGRCLIFKW